MVGAVLAAAAAAVGGGAALIKAMQAPPAAPPPPGPYVLGAAMPAAPPPPGPAAPPPPGPYVLGAAIPAVPTAVPRAEVTGKDLIKAGAGVFGGPVVGTMVDLGFKGVELQRELVGALGGNEATRAAVGVFGAPATAGFLAQQGTQALLGAVGVTGGVAKGIAQVVGISAATGPFAPAVLPAVAVAKLVGEGVSALVGVIGGPEAERGLRDAVKELDPFRNGSVVSNLVKGVADGIFGPPPKPPPAPAQLPVLTPEQKDAAHRADEAREAEIAANAAKYEKLRDKKRRD